MICPLCHTDSHESSGVITQEATGARSLRLYHCGPCDLSFLEDWADDRSAVYGEGYAAWGATGDGFDEVVADAKRAAFRRQLAVLRRFGDVRGQRLLDVGTGYGYLLDVAAEMGFDAHALDTSVAATKVANERWPGRVFCGNLADAPYAPASFDVITLTDVLEHLANPDDLMTAIRRLLKPDGRLLLITPNVNSFTRRLLGPNWFQFKWEHVVYWNRRSVRQLLERHGFTVELLQNNVKRFSVSYYYRYFSKYSLWGVSRIFLWLYPYLPQRWRDAYFANPLTGEMLVVAR